MKKNLSENDKNLIKSEFTNLLLDFCNNIVPSEKELDILIEHLNNNSLTSYDLLLLGKVRVLNMIFNYNK